MNNRKAFSVSCFVIVGLFCSFADSIDLTLTYKNLKSSPEQSSPIDRLNGWTGLYACAVLGADQIKELCDDLTWAHHAK